MKNYNVIERRQVQFRDSEIDYIKRHLPDTIFRNGKNRELCISKKEFDETNMNYTIWYGTIILGNYVAEGRTLESTIKKMFRHNMKYKVSFIRKIINKLKGA